MPWKHLSGWAAAHDTGSAAAEVPLTMVTLRQSPAHDSSEIAFHRDAEFKALMQWAVTGRFVLAFSAIDTDELTLLCVEGVDEVAANIARLPLVAAGLATAEIRRVAPVRLVSPLVPALSNGG